ncbi:MAG TPA: hypothetical protein VGP04_03225, partial [Pseudonocardiaceae bacterium]|nr:hypothetical protein [Pseudonocardiaceae bacterium]
RAAVRTLRRHRRTLSSKDPHDPDYRRLRYVRYADLCRVRHKSAYAARRVMSSAVVEVLVSGGRGGRVLGIIRAV